MPLSNIRIVLVRPQGSANVGAAARALKNMGLTDLVLVQPAPMRPFWAKTMAVHAADVLERARVTASLAEAVQDCGLVVGTTCRQGPYRTCAEPPRTAAPRIVAAAVHNRVAVIFGPEDHGLSNDDLKACQRLVSIPAAPDYPSLNLAQAVMLCCYEIRLASQAAADHQGSVEAGAESETTALAPAAKIEQLFERLQPALLSIGFLHRDNPNHIMYAFRRMLGRADLEERDVRILLGLARQIEWFGRGGWRTMAERRGLLQPTEGVDDAEWEVPA